MKDQVDAAVANGLRAAYVISSQSTEQSRAALTRLSQGDLDLIYLAPERLALGGFRDVLKNLKLSLYACL
jgi:ATP-dependent DNA helicase RecQ